MAGSSLLDRWNILRLNRRSKKVVSWQFWASWTICLVVHGVSKS